MRARTFLAAILVVGTAAPAAAQRRATSELPRAVEVSPDLHAAERKVIVDIGLDALAGDLAADKRANGYELRSVTSGSTLAGLGLKAGDVITEVAGVPLTDRAALKQAHLAARDGRWVTVKLMRGGKAVTIDYRLVDDVGHVARGLRVGGDAAYEAVLDALRPGVAKKSATEYEVDRAVLDAMKQQRRLIPPAAARSSEDGILLAARDSVLNLIGLEPLDEITAIDGASVKTKSRRYRARRAVWSLAADEATGAIELSRRGQPVTLRYRVVEGRVDADALAQALDRLNPPRVRRPPPDSGDDADDAATVEGIKKTGPTSYTVERKTLDKLLSNPGGVARGARVVPSVKNGKPNGFKLYAIRPSSFYAAIGLKNGDTVQAINGKDLTSADKALEVYRQVKNAKRITLKLLRRGKPVTLRYRIVR